MISLNDYELPTPVDYSQRSLANVVLAGFPEPCHRSTIEPLVTLSPDGVLNYTRRLAEYIQMDSIPVPEQRRQIKLPHLLLIRDYALSLGWAGVYLAGEQIVLEHHSSTETYVSPEYPRKERHTLVIAVSPGKHFNVRERMCAILDVKDDGPYCPDITGVRYCGAVDEPLPIHVDIMDRTNNPSKPTAFYHDKEKNVVIRLNPETGLGVVACERGLTHYLEIEFFDFSLGFIAKHLVNRRL